MAHPPAVEPRRAVDGREMAGEGLLAAVPPLGVLAVFAWCAATRGGTGPVDLAVVCAALGALLLLAVRSTGIPSRMLTGGTALFLALQAWLLVDGPLRQGWDLETLRVPALCTAAFLTVGTVARFDLRQRELLVRGFITVGVLHAVITLAGALESMGSCTCLQLTRAEGLLGSPNVLGVMLVTTAALTARELHRHWTPALLVALVVQGLAVLLTQSRQALVAALCMVAWYWTRASWKRVVVLLPWIVSAVVVVVVRSAHSPPDQRLFLWLAAARRISEHPIVGHGPAPEVYRLPLARARLTTQAHNEVLQFTADYGLVGLALLLTVLIVALRSVRQPVTLDRWQVAAGAGLLISGSVDFTLRVTAVAILAAAVAALALLPPMAEPASSGPSRSRRGSPAKGLAAPQMGRWASHPSSITSGGLSRSLHRAREEPHRVARAS